MSERLARECGRRVGDCNWYEHLDLFRLNAKTEAEIVQVKRRIAHEGNRVTLDQVTASLAFGTWRFMLTRRFEQTVWRALRASENGGMPFYLSHDAAISRLM